MKQQIISSKLLTHANMVLKVISVLLLSSGCINNKNSVAESCGILADIKLQILRSTTFLPVADECALNTCELIPRSVYGV